jgi:lipid II isoglutaminyl synthase (glutamine-hydrolysing)
VYEIKIKTLFCIIATKLLIFLSKKFFKGGSNFPGRVALKLDGEILSTISKNYKVILITGTNGKTTTSSMLYNIIKDNGDEVITNSTGANMLPGIVSCFISNYSFNKNRSKRYAVIEVDEANVKLVTKCVYPHIITITNLFRDQLDRYGEVYTTLKKILDGIIDIPETKLILNGDESLLGELDLRNPMEYYGFKDTLEKSSIIDINADAKFCKICKAPYKYNFITYNHLGDFYCENCGYKRPELTYFVDKIKELTTDYSSISINNKDYFINIPGVYNIYNALCSYSIARSIGIDESIIANSLEKQSSSFGRQETLTIDDKNIKIILVKNPAGFNQSIDTVFLDKQNLNLCLLLNDNYADGRDVSWIWDVNFEKLATLQVDKFLLGGIRLYDMAVRLKIAGLDTDSFALSESYDDLLNNIKLCESDTIYILATYTAMINFRKFLHKKGYIKNLW